MAMPNMTEHEFNKHCAELDGLNYQMIGDQVMIMPANGVMRGFTKTVDYYNDLNLLMPLAWKYEISVYTYHNNWVSATPDFNWKDGDEFEVKHEAISQDPIAAIRECLMNIKEHRNG